MKLQYLLIALMILSACQSPITSFEECVEAGNLVMESYPRQCRANGQTFVEQIEPLPKPPGLPEQPVEQELKTAHTCSEEEKQNQVCTREYRPVCGMVDNGVRCVTTPCQSMDAKTFSTGCTACADQAVSYYEGACEEQYFVVCKETFTGFDAVEHAKASNGICVDICPGNYDPYMTQIGVEVCIPHYGVEEINAWPTCERSSDSCECVKAYETTQDEQIDNPEYRCVPEQYGQRLLFRGGLDRLDESGQGSVMIA